LVYTKLGAPPPAPSARYREPSRLLQYDTPLEYPTNSYSTLLAQESFHVISGTYEMAELPLDVLAVLQ
jgi:hypothetical protein